MKLYHLWAYKDEHGDEIHIFVFAKNCDEAFDKARAVDPRFVGAQLVP